MTARADIAAISRPAAAEPMPKGRRFQPGQSGNPRGRSKRDRDIAEAAHATRRKPSMCWPR